MEKEIYSYEETLKNIRKKKIYSYNEMIENIKGYTKFDALLSEDEFEEVKEALSGEKNFKFIYMADTYDEMNPDALDTYTDLYWYIANPEEEKRNFEIEEYIETGYEGYFIIVTDWDTNKRYLVEAIDIECGILYEIK